MPATVRKIRGARLSPHRKAPAGPLQSRRIELGLTQDQVAESLGITARHVGNVEAARSACRSVWLQPLANVLQVPLETIARWVGSAT